ncbi:Multicopper oxidase [Halalkaliarchaeum sp. AArc-CO]|uniref:multicopper oxidase family protein n=1 Tax=Halalkaliarchaeum sp. AArc-CO TaxID=2866381 RepID=UPI00217EA552|nr:multicopper oxidase family protein [Halalkaliarchaeum sp. AArc-CO]UWG52169.1 Multicopper oxidase [Halalkaliarchaeum sp. AArc-CO]
MSRDASSPIGRRRALQIGAGVAGVAGLGAVGFALGGDGDGGTAAAYPEPEYGDPDRTYRLTASEHEIDIAGGDTYDGWTYDGSYPGPEIRALEGERVRVVVENDLPEETTVHWHGMTLRGDNAMDGVPGVTQESIAPGEEFVYEFDAEPAGTHWYHSHVGLQLDRELLGPLVIEERNPHVEYDAEHTLILDEYLPEEPRVESADGTDGMGGMGGMGGSFPGAPPAKGTLVNGALPSDPAEFGIAEGERVRLRLVNAAAATTYAVGIDDHSLTVTHADGPAVEPVTVDTLEIGMGERYDVIVEGTSPGRWPIRIAPVDSVAPAGRGILAYEGATGGIDEGAIGGRRLRYPDLRSLEPIPGVEGSPDRTIDLELSAGGTMGVMGGSGEDGEWTINGQAFPDADPIRIEEGDHVRFRMRNRSPMRHPMHLHGHHFQVGDVVKDTITVPGHMGQVEFDFVADNSGTWLFHCHHLYHMETGMVRIVEYE